MMGPFVNLLNICDEPLVLPPLVVGWWCLLPDLLLEVLEVLPAYQADGCSPADLYFFPVKNLLALIPL